MRQILNSRNIRTSSLGSLIIKFSSVILSFLGSIFLARILGVENFGIYTLSYTTAMLLSVPVSLGLPHLVTRYVSKYEVDSNKSAIKGLLISSNKMVLYASLLVFIILILSYFLWWHKYSLDVVKTLWISFLIVPFTGLASIRSSALVGLKFVVLGQLPETLFRNFFICVVFFSYYILDLNLKPYEAMSIHVVSVFITYIIGFVFMYFKFHKKVKKIKPFFDNKLWIKEVIPFSINGGIQVVRIRVINYMLLLFGSFEAVAIFDIATKGANLVSFTLNAINSAIAPYISSAYEKDDFVKLQNILKKSSRIIVVSSLPVTLIFIIFGKTLISYGFGNEYSNAYLPLCVLCLGQFMSSVFGSVGLVMSMTGHQSYYVKVNFLSMILNLALGVPLVKYFDVIGASFLISIVLIIQNIILYVYVKKKMKLSTTVF